MAELYLAKDTVADRLVVIKRILPYLAQEEDFVRMFLDEARIASQLHHPSIITMHELGSLEGSIFIAMEFVEGVDLRKILQQEQKRGGVVPPRIAAWLTARLCEGLHYAHNRTSPDGKPMGIIHRDVSPQNLMVGYHGEVKLVDFGIAKATAMMERSKPGVIKGKFLYLSPEQLSQDRIDHRSDLFALGTMLYEICTGKSPFYKPTTEAVIYSIRAEDPSPPHLVRSGFPVPLSKIIMRCLHKDRSRRYQQAAEVHHDLEAWLEAEAPTTREDVVRYVAALFGGEEERTVLYMPESAKGSREAKTASARPVRVPQPSKPADELEDSIAATAPEGRRPTPAPMKNPFDDDPATVLGLPGAAKPLGRGTVEVSQNSVSTARVPERKAPAVDDYIEPTAISQSGKAPRPTGDSMRALTPTGFRASGHEPTAQLPTEKARSSKVFEVPFEFARDEVPTRSPPARPTRAAAPLKGPAETYNEDAESPPEPQSDPGFDSASGDGADGGEGSIAGLIDAAVPSSIRNARSLEPGETNAEQGDDDEDDESTADYRRSQLDDVPSLVTRPSALNPAGPSSRLVIIGAAVMVLVALGLGVAVYRSRVRAAGTEEKPTRTTVREIVVDAGAAAVALPVAVVDAGSGEPAVDAGAGGGGGEDSAAGGGAGGGGGAEIKLPPPPVARTTVIFDAPKGTKITVDKRSYKPGVASTFAPGKYEYSYQCPPKRKKAQPTRKAKMLVPKQKPKFKVPIKCR